MALLGGLCVLIYIPAKLGANGIAQETAYVPATRWRAGWRTPENIWAICFIATIPRCRSGSTPLSPLRVAGFYATLIVSRFGCDLGWCGSDWCSSSLRCCRCRSFRPRVGFVLYLPLAGIALYRAVCLVRFKESLFRLIAEALARRVTPRWRDLLRWRCS